MPFQTIRALKKLKPMRQIEAVQLMIAMNRFTVSYSRSLVAATPEAMLLHPKKPAKGLRPQQIEMMEKESAYLDRDFKVIENEYGSDHLDLLLMVGYLSKVLGNARVVRHLAQHFPDILGEFQKMIELRQAA